MNNWQVVVPVYNEADHLENILETLLALGYTNRLIFVNDASTDSSGEILDAWSSRLRCRVVHLQKNAKKEGAIRAVLEELKAGGNLLEYTILLDADSFMVPSDSRNILESVDDAIGHLKANDIAGMAFRIEAIIPPGFSLLQWCIYADYAGVQFDNWLTSKYNQLWVINGPGGIFDSGQLLRALQSMIPDFETGDLQITVTLMGGGSKVAFWPNVHVKTWVPRTYGEYFRQRRRWERGSIKVLWAERAFYYEQFRKRRILAPYTALYLVFPLGIVALPLILAIVETPTDFLFKSIAWNYPFWVSVTAAKCAWNTWLRRDGMVSRACVWSCFNGFLFLVATGPARIAGFYDATKYIYRNRKS